MEKNNLSKLKSSWTKYDIVQVMDVIYSQETLSKYINGEAKINDAILKAFLNINSLGSSLPEYWIEIQNYPKEKKLFALFSIIFMHCDVIDDFASKYSQKDMKGEFYLEAGKKYTNIRSALIESGAAEPFLRRSKVVPYDFSPIFQNFEVGKLFKQLLFDRLSKIIEQSLVEANFYEICYNNNFHKALSINKERFKLWLEGKESRVDDKKYIDRVEINNFYSIHDVFLTDLEKTKEIYFLGENGDGKSLILMAIYLAFNRNFIEDQARKEDTGKAIDIVNKAKNHKLIGCDNKKKEYGRKDQNVGRLNNFFAYGTHRGRYNATEPEEYGFMSLFSDNEVLIDPCYWLKSQRAAELELQEHKSTKDAGALSVKFLEKILNILLERNVEIEVSTQKVKFIEKGIELEFIQLSEGYKSIIIFVCDLISRLHKNQEKVTEIKDYYGIVLVDEIELHLHPKWQRVLVSRLREIFPKIQFIFTTHSPTIIQGASDNAVIYRMYRNSENGKTKVSDPYLKSSLNHLMMNTLVTSPLFGLEDSRVDSENDNADTSDTYLLYLINQKIKIKLNEQWKAGKQFISDYEIDSLIEEILDKETE